MIIMLLISCPIRVKNLAGLVIGQHLVFDGASGSISRRWRPDQIWLRTRHAFGRGSARTSSETSP